MKLGGIRPIINTMAMATMLIGSAGARTKKLPSELRGMFKEPVKIVAKDVRKTLDGKTEIFQLSNDCKMARIPNKVTLYYPEGNNKTMIKNASGDVLSIARNKNGNTTAFELSTQRTMTKDNVALGLDNEFNPVDMAQSIPSPNDSNLFILGNKKIIMETSDSTTSFHQLDSLNNYEKTTTISNTTGNTYTTNPNFNNITFETDLNGNLKTVSGTSTQTTGKNAGKAIPFSFVNTGTVDTSAVQKDLSMSNLISK